MPDQTQEAPPSAVPAAELLRACLAQRDVPCPTCKYNLRGCVSAACPECGTTIVLSIDAQRQRWVPPLLAFLAFGWVLTAGLLNTARNAHTAYQYAQVRTFFGTSALIQGQVRISTGPGGTITFGGPSSSGALSQGGSTQPGLLGLAWGNVPWDAWWPLAWSLTLVVGGTVGVIALLRHRRHPFAESGWRLLRAHALVLFSVYAGFHLYNFGQEFLSW